MEITSEQVAHIAPAEIQVAGRTFSPATETTFEQDLFVLDTVSSAQMEKLSQVSDVDLNELGQEILLSAYRSGKMFLLLGGMVVEKGKPWTKEGAIANAEFFSKLSKAADKEALQDALVGVIISFFVNAEGSLNLSLTSSARGNPEVKGRRGRSAAPAISGSGTTSSGN